MSEAVFTADWSGARNYWPDMFADLGLVGKPNLRFLEIGCFEGRTSLWLIESVLTDESSHLVTIDTFQGSEEFGPMGLDGNSFARFEHNLGAHIDSGKVIPMVGRSDELLRTMRQPVDFVYVDGSHFAADVLSDAVLAWPLLKSGGVMVFDDYEWQIDAPEWAKPKLGVQSFVAAFCNQLVVRLTGYQLVAEKL